MRASSDDFDDYVAQQLFPCSMVDTFSTREPCLSEKNFSSNVAARF
jgi:hypothetical protein